MSHPSLPPEILFLLESLLWVALATVLLLGAGFLGGYLIGSCGG